MAKKKETQAERPLTKRQLTHWQKQALRQRIIAISGVVTIVAVVAVIVSGWYFKQYIPIDKPLQETVIEVNGQKFSMSYYVDAIEYFIGGQTAYIQYALDPVVTNIEQIELMRENSGSLGVTITDAEVNKQIADNSLTSNKAVRDIIRGQLIREKLLSDYFGPKIPTSGEQRDVLAMFVESQDQLDSVKAQVDAGADFGQLAKNNSLESTTQGDSGALGSHASGVFDYTVDTTGLDAAIFSQAVGTWGTYNDTSKTKSVGYWIMKITERNTDNTQVRLSSMLLGSMEEASSVKARLDDGEDFTTLAQQYSQNWSDTAKDDLGYITSDSTAVYKAFAFSTDNAVGSVSTVIKDTSATTKGGYWLFKSLSTVTQDLTSDDKTSLSNKAFNAWLTGLQADSANKITSSLDDAKKAFATTQAGG